MPSSEANPSMVVTLREAMSTVSVIQAQTVASSSHTVHAEHVPRSHDTLVPVIPMRILKVSASVSQGSTCSLCVTPFTFNVTGMGPGPATGSDCSDALALCMFAIVSAVKPAPLRKPRREISFFF